MSTSHTQDAHRGTWKVSHHNPTMWWFILAAANIGAIVLLLLFVAVPFAGSRVPGMIASGLIWIAVNAILIPVLIVQNGKQLLLDFDRGVLTTAGVAYPASEFTYAVETIRTFPGRARMLTLVYERGHVEVQIDGFTPSRRSLARNDALLAFAWRWLPMPDQHRAFLGSDFYLAKDIIGKQEMVQLLRRR